MIILSCARHVPTTNQPTDLPTYHLNWSIIMYIHTRRILLLLLIFLICIIIGVSIKESTHPRTNQLFTFNIYTFWVWIRQRQREREIEHYVIMRYYTHIKVIPKVPDNRHRVVKFSKIFFF